MKFIQLDSLKLFRKSIGATAIKSFGILLSFAISAFLARSLTDLEFGIYELLNRYLQLAVLIALVGLQPALIKESALIKTDKKLLGSRLFTSLIISMLISGVLIIVVHFLNYKINQFLTPKLELGTIITIFSLSILPMVISRIYGSAFIGKGKIVESTLVNNTATVLFLASILSLLYFLGYAISLLNVIIAYSLSRVFVCLAITILWQKTFNINLNPVFDFKPLKRIVKEMFAVTIINELFLSVNTILLGIYSFTVESGYFSIALKIALLSNIFLQILNSTISPKIALLFKEKKIKELNTLLQDSTLLLTIIGLIITFTLAVFGNDLLLIWGENFKNAYLALLMLSVGQLINIITGPVGTTMAMIGEEKTQRQLSLIYASFNVLLALVLIPIFGIDGAAFSYMVSISILNIHRLIYLKKSHNIRSLRF